MGFVIKFLALILITFMTCKTYEKRGKNERLTISIYFAVVAVVFLL